MFGDILGKFLLTIITNHLIQLLFAVGVYDRISRKLTPLVHSHVQWGVCPVGKSTA